MKKLSLLLFALIIGIQNYAQSKTEIINYNNLTNKNKIWELLGKGIANYHVDLMYIYGNLFVTDEMPDSATHEIPTLSDAYLFPMYSNLKKNGNETIIHDKNDEAYIVVDFHGDLNKGYSELKSVLAPMNGFISNFNGELHEGKLRFLVKDKLLKEKVKADNFDYFGLIGNLEDLDADYDAYQMPIIEIDFTELTNWNGVGNIPFNDYMKIKELINKIHAKGKKISIVNCPNHESSWEVLCTSKIDYINTNNPDNICNFLSKE